MESDSVTIRDRAWVECREAPYYDVEEPLWFAEDPVTECVGVGDVEAEAVGNLVAAVTEYQTRDGSGPPLLKLSGKIVVRPSHRDGNSKSILEWCRSLF